MNILILQGPNLNLLGLKSAPTGDRLTLDKLNKALRKHVHRQETTLKFLQTHKPLHQSPSFRGRILNHFPGYLLNLALRAWIIFYPQINHESINWITFYYWFHLGSGPG